MVLAIFTLMLVSTISLIVALVYGYLAHLVNMSYVSMHIIIGLPATLLMILTHCIIMFYFIGSGKTLKEAVEEHKLSPNYIHETKVYKRITSPLATYAMLAAVLMACFGGAVQVGKMASIWHEVAAWGTLFLHLWACVQETRYIIENQLLGNKAVQEIQKLKTKE